MIRAAPDHAASCGMRAQVLCGDAVCKPNWKVGPRTAIEIKEAATWHRRAATLSCTPVDKLRDEMRARLCDEVADPLLAKEEAEAAKARAAAETEAAEARAAAEAKAQAAAEGLLAEEEKEKTQASTKAGKAKQGKVKKGKAKP